MAEASRSVSLMRALDSVNASSADSIVILVVVNGNRFCSKVLEVLQQRGDVDVVRVGVASAPNACLVGRRLVKTPYFSFLDDDDEYLPGSTDLRLSRAESVKDFALVVANGYRHVDGHDRQCLCHLESVSDDPLTALLNENWLVSCGVLFSSKDIDIGYFEDSHDYVEWTWLAFKICLAGKRIVVLNAPVFRVHETVGSASKSPAYDESILRLYRRLLCFDLPLKIRLLILKKIGSYFHVKSEESLRAGFLGPAWLFHLKSLLYYGGIQYFPYTRHLLRGAFN